jgi:hypothetical protein
MNCEFANVGKEAILDYTKVHTSITFVENTRKRPLGLDARRWKDKTNE